MLLNRKGISYIRNTYKKLKLRRIEKFIANNYILEIETIYIAINIKKQTIKNFNNVLV